MSWIFGITGNIKEDDISKAKGIRPEALFEESSDYLYISSGGIGETCFYSKENRLIVCGIGISPADNLPNDDNQNIIEPKILDLGDWISINNNPAPPAGLNGHFIRASWDDDSIRFSNDIFGLRDLYFYSIRGHVVFSTRLDWIARYAGGLEIDYNELSSHWLLSNQMSFGSFAMGVKRLAAGGNATIANGKLIISSQEFTPEINGIATGKSLYAITKAFVEASGHSGKDITLSLSGGLDSRFLMAVMIGGNTEFDAVSFGPAGHPDSLIAEKMCRAFGIAHTQLDSEFPGRDECLKLSKDYTSRTMLLARGSEFLHFGHYSELHGRNKIVIDAGWGEIARRGLFNNALVKAKYHIINKNAAGLFDHIRSSRPNIFSGEVHKEMRNNATAHLQRLLDGMPAVEDMGVESWLDLFAIRTKMPNNTCPEQSRVDGLAMCYTPFVQPDLINLIFNMPLADKKNSRAVKKIISEKAPGLSEFPLVKGTTQYPYSLPTLPAKVYTVLKSKALPYYKSGYHDNKINEYLDIMKEPVLDSISSASFRNYDYYNHERISEISGLYYNRNKNNRNLKYAFELDWWFTFDMFRRSLSLED